VVEGKMLAARAADAAVGLNKEELDEGKLVDVDEGS